MGRAILKQHHPRQRTSLTLAPVNPAPGRLCRQAAQLKHALRPGVGTSKRLPAGHRHAHDLLVEVFDPKVEITGTEHLRHPCGLRFVSCSGAHPSAPTVDQPILPAILKGVPQTPEMALAEAKKLSRFNTAQASRPMRTDRIQNTRHPNLRQHAVLRSKNRTNHVLPKPDISCARDTLRF